MKKYLYKARLIFALTIFAISIVGILGLFYPIKIFDIQFLPLFEKLLKDFSIIGLALFLALTITTFLFGRIYCSLLCPFGILQEISAFFFKFLPYKKNKKPIKNYPAKYFIATIGFGLLIGGSVLAFQFLDPYTNFGGLFTASLSAVIISILVLVLAFFKDRFFCINICPVGTILGLISKFSPFKISISDECLKCKKCEKICPADCINIDEKSVDNETCIKCLKCTEICPKGGIGYSKIKKEIAFSANRRTIILSSINLVLLGAVIQAGNAISQIPSKLKNIILPAGAVDEKRLLNSCLNCNLCVQHCPNKIIKKADSEFNAIHLDYSEKGCKYDCNKCSEVCPSGAIKKLSLEEKQKTRIGLAVLSNEKCNKCLKCKNICPYNAIIIGEDNSIKLDPSKCVGCGLCKSKCTNNAIEIYSVKEQKTI